MATQTVLDIIRERIADMGYDGLCMCMYGCGCELDDLAPCGAIRPDCVPARKVVYGGETVFSCDGDCDWHVESDR